MKRVIAAIVAMLIIVSSVSAGYASDLKGDANDDGAVNSQDALHVLQYVVGATKKVNSIIKADVNRDLKINSVDAIEILKLTVSYKEKSAAAATTPTTKKTTTTTTTTKKTTTTTTTKKTTTTTTTKITTTRPTTTAVSTILASNVRAYSTLEVPSGLKLTKDLVPVSYSKKLTGTASAYSGGGVTATGKNVRPGYIAVNPNQIPYHTKMWIVSNDGKYVYGYASAEDTGGFIYWTGSSATLCDLYFSSSSTCYDFGRRGVTIYIL